jgi:hypothetical protein
MTIRMDNPLIETTEKDFQAWSSGNFVDVNERRAKHFNEA